MWGGEAEHAWGGEGDGQQGGPGARAGGPRSPALESRPGARALMIMLYNNTPLIIIPP